MTKYELQKKSKEEVIAFIRERLSLNKYIENLRHVNVDDFKKEHLRFNMTGYDIPHNLMVLNMFADIGIYGYTSYLFLSFYKGNGTLYLKYFYEDIGQEFDFSEYGTVEIIFQIFQKTICSNKTEIGERKQQF